MSANLSDIAFSVIIKNDGIDDIVFKTIMLKGEKGNSVSRVEKTSTSGLVDTYTIYLTDGTAGGTFTVTNGNDINIDDTAVSYSKTWSSQKIKTELDALESETSDAIDALSDMIPKTGTIEDVAMASFSDGADDVPVSELIVDIEPVQAGSGEPSPDNERPISGWTECNLSMAGKNITPQFRDNEKTQNGITVTPQKDGSIRLHGTSTSQSNFLVSMVDYVKMLPSGTYTFNIGNYQNYVYAQIVASGHTLYSYQAKDTYTYNNGLSMSRLDIGITGGAYGVPIDVTIYPQLEVGSQATAFKPYKGDTAITDFDGNTVYKAKLNVLTGLMTILGVGVDLSTFEIGTVGDATVFFKQMNNIVVPPDNSTIGEIMAEKYSPIRFNAISVGVGCIAIRTTGAIYVNTGSTTAPVGLAVYDLAEPQEIQLTPVQVRTLLNNNNIFADTGNIEKLGYFKKGSEAVAKMIEAYMRASE